MTFSVRRAVMRSASVRAPHHPAAARAGKRAMSERGVMAPGARPLHYVGPPTSTVTSCQAHEPPGDQ